MTKAPPSITHDEALARAKSIAPVLEENASHAERDRTLPRESVQAMKDAGIFKLFVPRELGGYEVDFATQIAVVEELARADGSAGWIAIANGPALGFAGAYLGNDAVSELFGNGQDPVEALATEPTRYVSWRVETLRRTLAQKPSLRAALQTIVIDDLSSKLRTLAKSAGP